MDLRAMVAAKVAEALSDDGDEAPPARPDIRAQRMELLSRFADYAGQHAFKPGDLVAEKDGLGTFKQDTGARAIMFWRALNPTDSLDAAIIERTAQRERVNRVDCIVATVEADDEVGGSSVVFHSHDSSRLRPLTAEERAELDALAGGDEAPGGGE